MNQMLYKIVPEKILGYYWQHNFLGHQDGASILLFLLFSANQR
jgi:hypothetical protein